MQPNSTPFRVHFQLTASTPDLWAALRASEFGIICIVPDNLSKPWVAFEAGALACASAEGKVAPLLVGPKVGDLAPPLTLLQCTVFGKQDVLRLVKTINGAHRGRRRSIRRLEEVFDKHWDKLRGRVRAIDLKGRAELETIQPSDAGATDPYKDMPELDELALTILAALGKSIYQAETAYGISLKLGRSEKLIKIKLKDLMKWGAVKSNNRNMNLAYFSTTDVETKALYKLGII